MWRGLVVVALCVSLLSTAACNDGSGAGPTSTAPAPAADPPVFEPGPCDTSRIPEAARTFECGVLVVPLDRSRRGGPMARLPVAVARSASEVRKPDPIVYFSGGPGDEGLGYSNVLIQPGFATDRDIIFFDQRGTGASEPALNCPEVEVATTATFETADPAAVEMQRMTDAFAACRARLVEGGVRLDLFNTPVVADDAADLKRALGIDEWNLLGVSYGTTVVLEMLRRHPDGVRSAVIDSVYPPDVPPGSYPDYAYATRALDALVAGCGRSSECAAAYPDLGRLLDRTVASYDAEPQKVKVTVEGRPITLTITGGDITAGVYIALSRTGLIPSLPYAIDQLSRRDPAVVQVLAEAIPGLLETAEGQMASVECADRQALVDPEVLARYMADNPRYAVLSVVRPVPDVCPVWDVPSVDRAFNELYPSEVPVLAFGGEYDPQTPPEYAERTAGALGPSATFVFVGGIGHGAIGVGGCPLGIADQFVADPQAPPDTSCAGSMPEPNWTLG